MEVVRTNTLRCRRPVVLSHTLTNLSREAEAKRPVFEGETGKVASKPNKSMLCSQQLPVKLQVARGNR
jgi:hypothetical protein